MPTFTITIDEPILNPGDTFDVSHRLVGGTTWTSDGAQDNDPFDITDSDYGDYEIMVEVAGCPAIIYGPIPVFPSCSCPTVSNVQLVKKTGAVTVLRMTFTGALPTPPCGWIMTVQETGKAPITTYPATITNPFEVIVNPDRDYAYFLKINCCTDEITFCASGQEAAIGTVNECDPMTVEPSMTGVTHAPVLISGKYYLIFNVQQSDPPTLIVTVKYAQLILITTSGSVGDSGLVSIKPVLGSGSPYNWEIRVPVNPNPPNGNYTVGVLDICGKYTAWE